MKRLFHINGNKGSGKSLLLQWLSEDGFYTTEVRFHLEKAMREKIFDAKKIPDPFWWTKKMINICYEDIKEKDLIFLTGLYSKEEIKFFEEKGYEVHLVGIQASEDVRHERILKRAREKEEGLTKEQLEAKDRKRQGKEKGYEDKADVESLIKDSEIVLKNESTIQKFRKEYERLKDFLGAKYKISFPFLSMNKQVKDIHSTTNHNHIQGSFQNKECYYP